MDPTTFLLVSASALAALALLWRAIRPRRRPLPYSKRPSLLTPAEMRFYRALLRATPAGLMVFVKVRLMDVVSVPDGMWQEYGARGSGMHLDFVLADASTTEPHLVVELDDRSHWRADAKERDAFKNAALGAAGVPMLRVAAAGRYEEAEIRSKVRAALSAPSG